MKTNLKFVAAGFLAGAASLYLSSPLLAAVGEPHPSIEKNALFGPQQFLVSIHQINNSGKISLHVEKKDDIKLTVTLRNTVGDIVNIYSINKKQTDFNQDYDFSQAEAGTYDLVVSDGHQAVTKKINFQGPQLVTTAKFTIN